MGKTLTQYRAELKGMLSVDPDDELWGDDELDSYINWALTQIWVWLVSADTGFHVVKDDAYVLLPSGIVDKVPYDLPSGVFAPLTLDSGSFRYEKIDRSEATERSGWYVEGTKLYVVRARARTGNHVSNTRDFTASAWTATTGSVDSTAVACVDQTIRTTNTFSASGIDATLLQTVSALSNAYWSFGVWLRRKTGTGTVSITIDGANYTDVTLSSSWQRFVVSGSGSSATVGIKLSTSGDEVYVDDAVLAQPDLTSLRYTSFPDALTEGASVDTLPDDQLRYWVPDLARVRAVRKEQSKTGDDFKEAKEQIRDHIRGHYPRVDMQLQHPAPYDAYGFDA